MPKLGFFEAMGLEPPDLTFGPDDEEDDMPELTPYQIARERADEIRAKNVETIQTMLARAHARHERAVIEAKDVDHSYPWAAGYAAQCGMLEAMLERTCRERDELIRELERAVRSACNEYYDGGHAEMIANRWGLCLESEE
jgi:hypothetical protein